jgi:hypothetical protein
VESLACRKYARLLRRLSMGPQEGQPWPRNKSKVPLKGFEGFRLHTCVSPPTHVWPEAFE